MVWNIEVINKLWKATRVSLTLNGSLPLTPRMEMVQKCVKSLVANTLVRSLVWTYCGVAYFLLPFGLFRMSTLV